MNEFRAVLFDADGTLLDVSDFNYQTYLHTLALHSHLPITYEQMAKVMGLPLDEIYRQFSGIKDVSSLIEEHRRFQSENLGLVRTYPNTLITLDSLKRLDILLAVVTTRARVSATANHHITGIDRFLDVVITSDDVKHLKPDPEPVLLALDRLSIPSQEALMVGDSPVDIEAGRSAGVRTVGAVYGFHGPELATHKPDHLIQDISEILDLIRTR